MFFVPRIALPHLISALKAEIAQEQDTAAWIFDDGEDDYWPEGYDANDLPLFEIVLKTLVEADRQQIEEINLSGKPLAFLIFPLPEYLRGKGSILTVDERHALEGVLGRSSAFVEQLQANYQNR